MIPITVLPGEDQILINMTISASGYEDKYFETYIAIQPFEIDNKLNLEVNDFTFSIEDFNLTFSIFDDFDQIIDFATLDVWWNGSNVSTDIQNLGNGIYFISLAPVISMKKKYHSIKCWYN